MSSQTQDTLSHQVIEHIPALRRYARLLTRSADQADDLVQDCLERALSRGGLYQQGTNLRAWLFTVMRNIAITQMRRDKLRRTYASERLAMDRRSEAPNQIDVVALKDGFRLLQSLTPGERQAVALLGVHDLSYEQAARVSGAPVGTMKSRLSRGRQRRRRLTPTPSVRKQIDAVLRARLSRHRDHRRHPGLRRRRLGRDRHRSGPVLRVPRGLRAEPHLRHVEARPTLVVGALALAASTGQQAEHDRRGNDLGHVGSESGNDIRQRLGDPR